jgi:hypothetical protein
MRESSPGALLSLDERSHLRFVLSERLRSSRRHEFSARASVAAPAIASDAP